MNDKQGYYIANQEAGRDIYNTVVYNDAQNSPFQCGEDFFKLYLDSKKYINHLHPFIGRDGILNEIEVFVHSDKQILILSGRGGIGKSKILFEFYSHFAESDSEYELKFLRENTQINNDTLRQLSTRKKYIIVIDDAHRSGDLAKIFDLTDQHHEDIKLILSCRSYGINYIKSELNRFNFNPDEIDYLEIKNLKKKDIEKLGSSVLGEDYQHFLDSLVQVAHDSPLVLVIGGRLIKEKAISPDMLESHKDFQDLVFNRFQEVVIGNISDRLEEKLCRELLMLISALSPFRRNDEGFIKEASDFLNIETHQLIDAIGILESAEILDRRGYLLRIIPDVLSDYILYNACVNNQGEITGYAERVIETFWKKIPENLMTNLSELDWRIKKNGLSINLLDQIWMIIEKSLKEGSNYQRVIIFGLIEKIAYFQPSKSLGLVEYAMQNPSVTNDEFEYFETTNNKVIDSLADVLKKISYNIDYLPRCYDILWKLGQDMEGTLQSETSHPIRILADIVEYGLNKPPILQEIALDAVEKWLKYPDVHEHIHSPIDALDPILKKEGITAIFKNHELISKPFIVEYDDVKIIRGKVIIILNNLANSDSIKVVNRALKSLIQTLKSPIPYLGITISDEGYKQWIPEQLEILKIIEYVIKTNKNPIIHLQVASDLRLFSNHNKFTDVALKVDDILKSVSDSFDLRMTRAVTSNFTSGFEIDYKIEEMRIGKIIQKIAAEFSENFDEKSAFAYLDEKFNNLINCKININPGRFLYYLGKEHPDLSSKLYEKLIFHPFSPVSNYISSLLSGIRESDIDQALELINLGIKTEYQTICSGIASGYSCGWWGSELNNEDFTIIENLLKTSDKKVKGYAITSLSFFKDITLKNKAMKLAIDIDIADDRELADNLCSIFQPNSGIGIADLEIDEIGKILFKLENVNTLDVDATGEGFWICQFLNSCSEKIPDTVIDLMFKRINHAKMTLNASFYEHYQPLPHHKFHECLKGIFSSPDYISIMKKVRDRIISNEKDISWISILFSKISNNYSPESLEILNEWIDTSEKDKIVGIGFLIRNAPKEILFDNTEFISKLIETSYTISEECYSDIIESLDYLKWSGGKSGILSEPFPIDVKMRDLGAEYAKKYQTGSPTERFYDSLSTHARKSIEYQMRWAEEVFDDQ